MTTYGTIQIDVDGWWAYAAAYGEVAPRDPDPVFREALPRLRATLDRHGVRATFFVVGADLAIPWKRRLIADLARDGHEIANHTFSHPLSLPGLPPEEAATEIDRAESAIAAAVGTRPVGFRAPGYAIDETLYALLERRGYQYDASVLPTFWGGLIRAYQRRQSPRAGATVDDSPAPIVGGPAPRPGASFGRPAYGLAPLGPYRPSADCIWRRGEGAVWEVPVTTLPLARVPFHSTCVFSLGLRLFHLGRAGCRLAGACVNYVFHAIDLIDDVTGAPMLRRLAIRAPLARRQQLCDMILHDLSRTSRLVPTRDWVAEIARSTQHAARSKGGGTPPRLGGGQRLCRAACCVLRAACSERSEP